MLTDFMILSVGVGPFSHTPYSFYFQEKISCVVEVVGCVVEVVGCGVEVLVDLGHYLVVILLLEPLRLKGFRVGKKQREKVNFFGEKGWAVALASAPEKGTLNFPLGAERLAERPAGPSEV
uniref:Gag-pol protein n=1 Tax=Solanum tuberosum TaxID=4113 RepID=M1DYW0_SOLTU